MSLAEVQSLLGEYVESSLITEWADVTARFPGLRDQAVERCLRNPKATQDRLRRIAGGRNPGVEHLHLDLGRAAVGLLLPCEVPQLITLTQVQARKYNPGLLRAEPDLLEDAVGDMVARLLGDPFPVLRRFAEGDSLCPSHLAAREGFNALKRLARDARKRSRESARSEVGLAAAEAREIHHTEIPWELFARHLPSEAVTFFGLLYQGLGLEEIAEQLGVGRATAYYRFQQYRRLCIGLAERTGFETPSSAADR